MTDTSKDVERFHLNTSMGDMVRCKSGCFVSYADYSALATQLAEEIRVSNLRGNHIEFELLPQMADLSAQLEAANARADRARDDALGEAAGCIGHITRHEDLDAIFALRTKPPASVEPVTVQEAARVLLGDDYNSPMLEMLDKYNNDYDVGQDVLKALRAIAGEKP